MTLGVLPLYPGPKAGLLTGPEIPDHGVCAERPRLADLGKESGPTS